ncbi:MAG: hypothetical protein PHF86_05335 [Candidatus Nanoarchaeia archaeon]|nr:hypothetical protein [Candidatus Nanoarchaeia archaeon]
MSKFPYNVYATKEKVYIEKKTGCAARLCSISAEFYDSNEKQEIILECSFKKFQEKAMSRGYIVLDKFRPAWDIEREIK